MDFEIEDSGEDQDFSDDNYNRSGGGYGKHSYGYNAGRGTASSNSGVRRSTGSGFFSAGNDQDGDDYDFEYEDVPAAPSGRIAAFSPAAVNRKGGSNSKDFDVSSDYESSHDNYAHHQQKQRENTAKANPGLRVSVTSQESALEKAQNMLNRYSQKNKPSSYSEPATNFKAKKSAHFDEDDLSMDEELEEEDGEDGDDGDDAYMNISDSVDRSREKFAKSKAPSSGGGMGLKKSPATASLLPNNSKPVTTVTAATKGNAKDSKGLNKMMDDSNVSHIVHEESVHEYEDDEDVIDEEGEESEEVEDEYGDEEFDKNEEEDELGESIAQDDDEDDSPPKAKLSNQGQKHVNLAVDTKSKGSNKGAKDSDDDYEDDDDGMNENTSYSRMHYGQEDEVESVEGDEDYTESNLNDIAGWEPAASTNNVFNDISQVSKPDPVVSTKPTTSSLKTLPATNGGDKSSANAKADTVTASAKVTAPVVTIPSTEPVPSLTKNVGSLPSVPAIPSSSHQPQIIGVQPTMSFPPPSMAAPPTQNPTGPPTDPSQAPSYPPYNPYQHHPYYPPPPLAAPLSAPPGSATPSAGYSPYPYAHMPPPPYGYPPMPPAYGYYPPMPPAYGYPPYPYSPPFGYPSPSPEHMYPGHSQPHPTGSVSHAAPSNSNNIRASPTIGASAAALSALGNQPIVLELLKELSKVQEEANWARTKLAETLLILKETGQSLPSKSTAASIHHQQQPSPNLHEKTESHSPANQISKPSTVPAIATSKSRYGNSQHDDEDEGEDEYSEEYSEDFDVSQLNLSTSYRASRRNSPAKKNALNGGGKMNSSDDDHYDKQTAGCGSKKQLPPPMPQLREEDGDDHEDSRGRNEIESKTSPKQVPQSATGDIASHRINPQIATSAAFGGGRFSTLASTNEFADPFADTLARSFIASQELLRAKLESLRLKIQMSNKMSVERDELEEFTIGKNYGVSVDQPPASSLHRLKMQFETKRKQSEDRLKKLLTECYPDLDEEEVMKMAKLVE